MPSIDERKRQEMIEIKKQYSVVNRGPNKPPFYVSENLKKKNNQNL